jgi:hypothetical protein
MPSNRRTVRRRVLTLLLAACAATITAIGFASPAFAITHSQATAQLTAAGISWYSSGGCSNRNVPTCTSFEGIRQPTIDGVIAFKAASGCSILITAGTETGHTTTTYSHWNGYKVDISKATCVTNYIKAAYTYVGYISGWGYQYRAPSGNLYTDEGNHWDILFYTCGC